MTDWSDDDAFWQAMEPALCAPARLALAEGDVAAILRAVDPPPRATVLDLGCGPGAHAIAFARRGYQVVGVDRSARLLDRARAAAQARAVDVEWIEADMRRFRRPSFFDMICSLYSSFGYFDDPGNRMVLENVLASLRPGGALVLDVISRETVTRTWQERRSLEIGGVSYSERRHLDAEGTVLVCDWVIVRDGQRQEFRSMQRLYSGTELRHLLSSVGFRDVTLWGAMDAKVPFDESATRLVAVARASS